MSESPFSPLAPPRPETELSRRFRFQLAGRVGAFLIRIWGRTLRVEWDLPPTVGELEREGHRMIHAFWHAHILTLSFTHRNRGIVVLVSQHRDGEYISQVVHHLGFGTVRGSSSRGGVRGLMAMARLARKGYPVSITPDGPRGPRHELQPGLLLIAQKSGRPIVPFAVGARRCRYLKSWDRFELPSPFSTVRVVAGEPIQVPADTPQTELMGLWLPRVKAAMAETESRAAAWAVEGKERP